LLAHVQIPDPERRIGQYPRNFRVAWRSVLIARALACNPKVLIADEPATARCHSAGAGAGRVTAAAKRK
jgi:ABC-type dipeptide/oligopeptide/nickel transport system ATPase component